MRASSPCFEHETLVPSCSTTSRRESSPRGVHGPTNYEGDTGLRAIVNIYMIIQFITRMIMAHGFVYSTCGYFLPWIIFKPWDILDCERIPTEGLRIYSFVVFILNILNAFNFWPYFYSKSEPYLLLEKRDRGVVGLFGILDCIISLGMIISSFHLWQAKVSAFSLLAAPSAVLLLFSLIVFFILVKNDIRPYKPLDSYNEFVLKTRVEEHLTKEKQITVRESGTFRIVIENCGQQKMTGTLKIERKVVARVRFHCGHFTYIKDSIAFDFPLSKPLEPGQVVIFNPETHEEDDSYSIEGFRSFGDDRGKTVKTSVSNETCCLVIMKEEYRKRKYNAEISLRIKSKGEVYGSV